MAIDALSAERRATPANIDALVQALGSKDARTLLSALVVVGNIAARPTHPPLTAVDAPLAQLLKHPASDARAQAVRTAGATRNPQWLAPLVSAAQDSAANVRQAAAQALGQYPSAQAEEALRRLLGDEVPEVRLAALESMRRIRPK